LANSSRRSLRGNGVGTSDDFVFDLKQKTDLNGRMFGGGAVLKAEPGFTCRTDIFRGQI